MKNPTIPAILAWACMGIFYWAIKNPVDHEVAAVLSGISMVIFIGLSAHLSSKEVR